MFYFGEVEVHKIDRIISSIFYFQKRVAIKATKSEIEEVKIAR